MHTDRERERDKERSEEKRIKGKKKQRTCDYLGTDRWEMVGKIMISYASCNI